MARRRLSGCRGRGRFLHAGFHSGRAWCESGSTFVPLSALADCVMMGVTAGAREGSSTEFTNHAKECHQALEEAVGAAEKLDLVLQ